MPNNTNYGELFCEAIDIIAKQRTQEVMYDKTVLGTIEDDSQAADGVYTVSYNQTKFQAFSQDTSYKKGNSVYIQIPQGDWNEQKNIVSRKSDKNSLPITYLSPFDTFVDITGNLITKNPDTKGLLANGLITEVPVWSYNDHGSNAPQKEEGMELASYTRLAMRGEFKAWLQELHAVSGSYGLKLRIAAISDDNKDYDSIEYYDYEFDCSKMRGNPYAFESYFQQEIVFDITEIYKIKKMSLIFYQRSDFYDNENNLIPTTGTFYGEDIEIPLDNNLFVKDIYLALGYDSNEFDTDTVQIYSFDSTVYGKNILPLTENHKQLELRWVHKIKDYFKSIDFNDGLDFTIYWYRHIPGTPSHMARSGVGWSLLSEQHYNKTTKKWEYIIRDKQWLDYNEVAETGLYREPSFNSTWLIPDISGTAYLPGLDEEHIKAIVVYDDQYYISNTLSFYNTNEVVNKSTVDADQALTVACLDGTYGNYLIYNLSGSIIDHAQGDLVREFQAMFNLPGAEEAEYPQLTNAESIEWIIPRHNSMILIDDEFVGADTGAKLEELNDENFYHIFRYGNKLEAYDIVNQNTQRYRIRSFYSQTYSNNTIQCKVVKDGVTYLAVKELSFGPAGTNGSDYTFVLDFEKGDSAVTFDNKSLATTVRARLYDHAGKELDISGHEIKWGWRKDSDGKDSPVSGISITQDENDYRVVELKCTSSSMPSENYCILQAELTEWGDYPLVAYLPIPIRVSNTYGSLTGATSVIYETSGNVMSYYANPYELYYGTDQGELSGTKVSGLAWKLDWPDYPNDLEYMPSLRNDRLVPLSFYVGNVYHHICVKAMIGTSVVWVQPILLMQNRYPSTMINKWDGSLTIDKENNAILAAKIVAGRKEEYINEDGTRAYGFSGVMMGALGDKDAEVGFQNTTGLYGYHQGQQSFGFDQFGTGFIGKTGKGRIYLNGNESTITSAGFEDANGNKGEGVKIDLDSSPFIQIQGMAYTKDGAPVEIKPIFYIADGKSRQSFLQSANYPLKDSDDARGLHIDLNQGYIHAKKNFKLETEGFEVETTPDKIKFFLTDPNSEDKLFSVYYDVDNTRGGNYYLQSRYFNKIKGGQSADDPNVEGGVKLDLHNGTFEAVGRFSFKADNFELNAHPASGKPYFAIYDDCKSKHKLFYAAEKSYYLQSCSFDEIKRGSTVDGIDGGVKLDLSKGLFEAIGGFSFKADNFELNANPANDTKPYFAIYDSCDPQHTLFYAAKTNFYLQSCNYDNIKKDGTESGLHISFATKTDQKSSFKAYGEFDLHAIGSQGEIRISTNAKNENKKDDYPFKITGKGNSNLTTRQFHVDWQGKLYSTGGTIGGWSFYKQEDGETAPTQNELIATAEAIEERWNVLYATTKKGGVQRWHVFGANQDNVIAIGIPHNQVFKNHNFNQTDGKGAAFTVMYDGTMHARKGTIAGWYLTSSYIQNFDPATTPGANARITKLFSGTPEDGESGKDIYSIETDSINIKGTNSKLTIGNFLFTSNMLRVGASSPYQLVIDKEGNFGVGSVTLNNNVISKANFKVDSSGNTTIGGTADKPNFKIDNTGDLYVGPNGNLFNLKITNDGNLYISPSGTDANGKDAYQVAITNDGTLSLGTDIRQGMPYFKVTAGGTLLVAPKSATSVGDGNYYFKLTNYGTLTCGSCTITDYGEESAEEDLGPGIKSLNPGTSGKTESSFIYLGPKGKQASWNTTSSGNTYFRSQGHLYLAGTDGAVYLQGITFGLDNDIEFQKYRITSDQGKVLAKVVQKWCNEDTVISEQEIEDYAKRARYAYFA